MPAVNSSGRNKHTAHARTTHTTHDTQRKCVRVTAGARACDKRGGGTPLERELLAEDGESLESGEAAREALVDGDDVLLDRHRDLVDVGRFVQGLGRHALLLAHAGLHVHVVHSTPPVSKVSLVVSCRVVGRRHDVP